ncbi:MAG: S8 family serine peptidase [Pseudohongiellaceae bacterium]|nr:S8 family serine peptidase [Pseudohongiellaceae bacterium]
MFRHLFTSRAFPLALTLCFFSNSALAAIVESTIDEGEGVGEYLSSTDGGRIQAYFDASETSLKMATCLEDCNGESPVWQVVTVDNDGLVGRTPSVKVDSNGRPVIAYYDYDNANLKLATCLDLCESASPVWQIVTADGEDSSDLYTGWRPSLQLDSQDRPVISHYSNSLEALKMVTCLSDCQSASPTWEAVVVDDTSGTGLYSALQLDSQDRPMIAYYEHTHGQLWFASCSENCTSSSPVWDRSVIEPSDANSYVGTMIDMKLDSTGKPVISYHDHSNGLLRLASCTSDCTDSSIAQWTLTTVDYARTQSYSSLQLNEQDRPILSFLRYYASSTVSLSYCTDACKSESPSWSRVDVIDTKSNSGFLSHLSLELDDNQSPYITFASTEENSIKRVSVLPPPEIVRISEPHSSSFVTGDTLYYAIEFDQAVLLTGEVFLELVLDSGTVLATPYSIGPKNYYFEYVVTETDQHESESPVSINGLVLGSNSSLRDMSDNFDAVLTPDISPELTFGVNLSAYDIVIRTVDGRDSLGSESDYTIASGESFTVSVAAQSDLDAIVAGDCSPSLSLGDGGTSYTLTTAPVLSHCEIDLAFVSEQTIPFQLDEEYLYGGSLPLVNAEPAYERGLTGKGVTVGIIDTGLYRDSVELKAANITGYNYYDDTANLTANRNPHGTQVAGIIAGRRNGYGMHGVAYEADINFASGFVGSNINSSAQVTSINHMREHGVRIVNNSWGFGTLQLPDIENSNSDTLEAFLNPGWLSIVAAFRAAMEDDVIMVNSLGNNSYDHASILAALPHFYPELPPVMIGVANLDENGEIYTSSNRCGIAASWCVSAPGHGRPSANYSSLAPNPLEIGPFGGTSAAAPVVTGLGALLLEQFPWMTGSQIVSTILTTAENGTDEVLSPITGRGLINVGRAIDGPAAFEFEFEANTQGMSAEFANDISGIGSLSKLGSGTLIMSGNNSYTGTTRVELGELVINGSVASNTIVAGGKLSGNGQLEDVSAQSGTVAPGDGIGTLNVADLLLTSFSELEFELQSPESSDGSNNDLINVSGNLVLNGRLTIANANNLAAGTYTLMSYAGNLTDRSLDLPDIPGLSLSIVKEPGEVTLLAEATLSITDATINSGNLDSPTIATGASISGGTLSGVIRNSGLINGVSLAAGAMVSGGMLSGDIIGDANDPANIDNLSIASGTHLENVIIGANAVLDPGITIGSNVRFESDENIPAGTDITAALATVIWEGGDQREVIDLSGDIVSTSSLLSELQSLLLGLGVDASQEASGDFILELAGIRANLIPVRVAMAEASEAPGLYINDDGDIELITGNGRSVTSLVSLQESSDFGLSLGNLALAMSYDERANVLITTTPEDAGAYFLVRPDTLALSSDTAVGIHSRNSSLLLGTVQYYQVLANGHEDKLEQVLFTQPVDWPLLKASLLEQGLGNPRIDLQGIVSYQDNETTVRAIADYLVLRGFEDQATTGQVNFLDAGDLNGDGVNDQWMVFPNGDRQALYQLP